MSVFQDQVKKDLDAIFFNPNEHPELHNIDGQDVLCIIDTDVSQQLEKPKERREGTYEDRIMLYVKEADLPDVPEFGQIMDLDGEQWRVVNRNRDMGALTVTLEAIS